MLILFLDDGTVCKWVVLMFQTSLLSLSSNKSDYSVTFVMHVHCLGM
jgi:hypothetical protein